MTLENVRKIFCKKLSDELELFKLRKLQESVESIYNSAFEIDSMINIYEALMEISDSVTLEALLELLSVPELLGDFYHQWLKTSDSNWQEISNYIHKKISDTAKEKMEGVVG